MHLCLDCYPHYIVSHLITPHVFPSESPVPHVSIAPSSHPLRFEHDTVRVEFLLISNFEASSARLLDYEPQAKTSDKVARTNECGDFFVSA
jgi:hypothetical protein